MVHFPNGTTTEFRVSGASSTEELREKLRKDFNISTLNAVSFRDRVEVREPSTSAAVQDKRTSNSFNPPSQILRSQWDIVSPKFEKDDSGIILHSINTAALQQTHFYLPFQQYRRARNHKVIHKLKSSKQISVNRR